MSLEQQIACILQPNHQQIQKPSRHEQKAIHIGLLSTSKQHRSSTQITYRPTVNIEAVHSANVIRYVLAR